jgi:hypothetical protein
MSTEDYNRGRADARLDLNDERHRENCQRLDAIETKLDELVNSIAVAKGGIRILLAVGSLSATLGVAAHSVINWAWSHFK